MKAPKAFLVIAKILAGVANFLIGYLNVKISYILFVLTFNLLNDEEGPLLFLFPFLVLMFVIAAYYCFQIFRIYKSKKWYYFPWSVGAFISSIYLNTNLLTVYCF